MKTVLTFLSAFLICGSVNAQCYTVSPGTYSHDSLTAPTTAIVFDDQYSGIIPIGFPFCFYGASYPALLIGANGILSFDTTLANSYCQWPIGTAIPSTANPRNAILFPMQDLYSTAGGTMTYQTIGISPNRKFIVNFNSVAMYSCQTTLFTGEVKLYETSNVIEIEITQKGLCVQWNGGKAIEGIQNSTGTSFAVVPGRNFPTSWTAINETWLFTPSCNVCSGVGIAETQSQELNLFVSEQNQISIVPNGNEYKLISINNLIGQEISFTQTENTISLLQPGSGIYIINLDVNGSRISKKLLMK